MTMQKTLDAELSAMMPGRDRVFWAGDHPPLRRMASSGRIYDPDHDFRLPASLHRGFQAAMLVEQDLGWMKQWPVVLDEALRLLEPDGLLAVRATSTPVVTNFEMKARLLAWTGGRIAPVGERRLEGGAVQSVFRLSMPARPRPSLDAFSFCLISDGRRIEAIEAFARSVHAMEGIDRIGYEILVCGPASLRPVLARLGSRLRLVEDEGSFPGLGWITRKKNLLVQASGCENILIAHDRYTLATDFLTCLGEFGPDFSVLTCRQETADGLRFPDWVTLGSAWSATSPAMLPYGDYCRHLYVNGGLMIAKRDVLARTGWNELLFWMQAEDVELTRRLQAVGVVPRLARRVRAISAAARNSYLEDFETLPVAPRQYLLTHTASARGERLAPEYVPGTRVAFPDDPQAQALEGGLRLGEGWGASPGALVWAGAGPAEITVRLQTEPEGDLELVLETGETAAVDVTVNNSAVASWTDAGGRLRAVVAAGLRTRPIVRVRLFPRAGSQGEMHLRGFTLRRLGAVLPLLSAEGSLEFGAGSAGSALLGRGWSPSEDWGTWSVAAMAEMVLPLVEDLSADLPLRVLASVYAPVPGPPRIVGLSLNGVPFGHASLPGDGAPGWMRFVVPGVLLGAAGSNRLGLHPGCMTSPAEHGVQNDTRTLGIALRRMALDRADRGVQG